MFLSSVLLGSGMYSGQVFALENQTGTENEAEIEADIEQENKCKKDSECKNENEINNSLNIITQNATQSEPVGQTCDDCFTDNLTPDEIILFEIEMNEETSGQFSSITDLCNLLYSNPTDQETQSSVSFLLFESGLEAGIDVSVLEAIADCLDELFGITIPRPA